jgi:hypothetical protein
VPPDTAHFHQRPELRSFQFINKVINFVGTTHEFGMGCGCVNSNLDLAVDLIVELCIYQDVLGSLLESILDPDDFELVRDLITHSLEFLKNLKHLFFFGCILAAKKV